MGMCLSTLSVLDETAPCMVSSGVCGGRDLRQSSCDASHDSTESLSPVQKSVIESFHFDSNWVNQTEATNKQTIIVLQARLSSAQSSLNKEAVRSAYVALAQFKRKIGRLDDALNNTMRALDYCTTREQTAQISSHVLELSLALENYGQVKEFAATIENTLRISSDSSQIGGAMGANAASLPSKLQVARGLTCLASGDYRKASEAFSSIVMSSNVESLKWSAVVHADDVALYAALTSLASQSQRSLRNLAEHQEAMEAVPNTRDLLVQFTKANYRACFLALDGIQSQGISAFPDLYLHSHMESLVGRIRENFLVAFLAPYKKIDLDRIRLGVKFEEIPTVLVQLLGSGALDGMRFDEKSRWLSRDKAVAKNNGRERWSLGQKLTEQCNATMDEVSGLFFHLSCVENSVSIESDSREHSVNAQDDTYSFSDGHADDIVMSDAMVNPADPASR